MVQLDAAAMNLKRRFEDPNIAASLEAQQAYTRALAPGGVSAPHLHSRDAAKLHCPRPCCSCTYLIPGNELWWIPCIGAAVKRGAAWLLNSTAVVQHAILGTLASEPSRLCAVDGLHGV